MSQCRAHLNVFGRRLLVMRVVEQGWPVAHAAKAQGVSRQCAHRWINRWRAEGEAGLVDRSSRPHRSPGRTSGEVEARIVATRVEQRRGQDWLGAELGVPARTVSRVLRRYRLPYLHDLDPITGAVIRTSKATAVRYERDRPGELVHVDVKKIGKIPDGGGWRLHGREATVEHKHKRVRIGYDFVHSMVDDCSRLAYSEIHDDETAPTCAAFLARAAAYFAGHGITVIERVHDRQRVRLPQRRRLHSCRRRHGCPAEVHPSPLPLAERQSGEVQPHPPGRVGLPATVHHQPATPRRPCPLARAVQHSTPSHRTRRQTPDQPAVTNLMAEYT